MHNKSYNYHLSRAYNSVYLTHLLQKEGYVLCNWPISAHGSDVTSSARAPVVLFAFRRTRRAQPALFKASFDVQLILKRFQIKCWVSLSIWSYFFAIERITIFIIKVHGPRVYYQHFIGPRFESRLRQLRKRKVKIGLLLVGLVVALKKSFSERRRIYVRFSYIAFPGQLRLFTNVFTSHPILQPRTRINSLINSW